AETEFAAAAQQARSHDPRQPALAGVQDPVDDAADDEGSEGENAVVIGPPCRRVQKLAYRLGALPTRAASTAPDPCADVDRDVRRPDSECRRRCSRRTKNAPKNVRGI